MKIRLALASALLLTSPPAFAAKGGTDILHLTLRTSCDAVEAPAQAGCELDLKLRQQGKADVQKFDFGVEGLAPETRHFLFAVLRDDPANPVEVRAFDTDADGDASFKLMHLGHNGNPAKKFPAGLDPLSSIEAFQIRNEADVTLLEADLLDPDRLGYLVKRKLTNEGFDDDASGSIFLKQRGSKASFRLAAEDLEPGIGYELWINGAFVESYIADDDGRIRDTDLPGGTVAPYHMSLLELRTVGGVDVVLGTELP